MHISSKIGTEIFKGEYQIIDDINGIPTLETDYSKTRYNHAEPLFMMSNAYTDKFVMIIKESNSKGESSKTRYTAVHSFIYDFSLDRLYDTYTQYFSLENILGLLFSDTEYDFEVKADQTYYSLDFQNFGDNDKMNLLNQICERWELEYHITGKTVVLGQRRGQDTNKQFRYKMNITDSSVDLDISEGATYIRATFGSEEKGNLTEREMTHPLADRFGIKHAKPYSNENISQEETMQKYMQQKIEDTWKLSIKIDISDIEGSGDVEVGDTVWAIDERLNLSYNTRVIELKRYYNKHDEVYRTEAVIGNRTFADTVSTQERSQQQEIEDKVIDRTNKMLADMQAEFDNDFNAARDEYRNQLNTAIEAVEEEVAAKDAAHKALWEETDQKIDNSIQKIIGGDISILDTNILDMSGLLSQKIEMSDLDGIKQDISNAQGELATVSGELDTTKTNLQQQLDDAKAQFDGLEIGARNLLPAFTSNRWTHTDLTEVEEYSLYFPSGHTGNSMIFIDVEKHSDYTISFNSDYARYYIYEVLEDGSLGALVRTTTGSETYTFNTEEISKIRVSLNTFSGNVQEEKNIWNLQLEKGTIATDWTPAPEDLEMKITTLNQEITVIDGLLQSKVDQTEVDALKGTVTEQGTQITQTAADITTKADKSVVDTLAGTVTNVESTASQNAAEIEKRLTKEEFTTQKGLLDADITKWSNKTTETAEGLAQSLTRISSAEGKIATAETNITTEAGRIDAVLSRTETAEDKIEAAETDISVQAGRIDTVLSRTSTAEGKISAAELQISANTNGLKLKAAQKDLDSVTGRVSTAETDISVQAGKISSTITKQNEHSTAISTLESTSEEFSRTLGTVSSDLSTMDSAVGTLKSDVSAVKQTASTLRSEVTTLNKDTGDLKDWRAEKGSLFEQTAEGFRAKVWRDDIALGVENLIPDADFVAWDSSLVPDHWKKNWGAGHTFAGRQNTKYLLVRANNETVNTSGTYGVHSPTLTRDIIAGEEYTLVFNNFDFGDFPYDYMYIIYEDSPNQNLSIPEHDRFIDKWSDGNTSKNVERLVLRFTAYSSGKARVLFGKRIESGQQTSFYINEPMLVRGNVAPKSFAPAPADSLKQTDFVIQSDGFLLGTREVGGDVFAAGIVGDSSGLKLLGDNISVAGNLKVKNSVNAWSVNAVSANIGKVFADSVSSSFIESKHVKFDTAFINAIITKTAFINNAEIKAANIKDLSATSISGGILKDTGNNMNWNLNTGRFAIKRSTFVYEEYGNAMVFGKDGYTGGLVFSQDTVQGLPVVAIGTSLNTGTTLNPRLSLNAYTYNGISFFSGNSGENQTNLTTDNMLFRSESGEGSQYDRGLRLTMYDVNASTDVILEPYSARPLVYKHYLGTNSNPFTGIYTTNLWKARVRDSGSGVTFYSENGKYGISVSDGGVFAIKNGKFTALHI